MGIESLRSEGGELPTNRKWVSELPSFLSGLTRSKNPMSITGVITHLLSGMSHQVDIHKDHRLDALVEFE